MSVAKKAVDSTIKKILNYTAEIIASIFILIIICLPLAFVVPMWIQRVALGTPVENLVVNPVAWFGTGLYIIILVGLSVLSFIIGYPLALKAISEAAPKETASIEEEEDTAELPESESDKDPSEEDQPDEGLEEMEE